MSAVANLYRPLDPQALRQTLEAHRRYLAHRTGGRRANLAYADLSGLKLEGFDLSDADLTGARLSGASANAAAMPAPCRCGARKPC